MIDERQDVEFREQRRAAIRQQREITGLDYVLAEPTRDPQRWRLRLHFLSFTPVNIVPAKIRIRGVDGSIDTALRVEPLPDTFATSGDVFVWVQDRERAETLGADSNEYSIELTGAVGLDRFFTTAPFRFDGRIPRRSRSQLGDEESGTTPDIDYLAKDYESFRRLMLETMSRAVPAWTERNPADIGVTVVEALAAEADYLSYFQDAVGTEAYLDTARLRTSARRHLRLLSYYLHEGCNSRVWVHFEMAEWPFATTLRKGTRLLTRAGDLPAQLEEHSWEYNQAIGQGSSVFETLHEAKHLSHELNRLEIHTWGAEDYCLPKGATSAALVGWIQRLEKADVLIFEEVKDRRTGDQSDADPGRRHAVRLIETPRFRRSESGTITGPHDPLTGTEITEIRFHEDDALPFPFTVRLKTPDRTVENVTVVRGNVVLADNGMSVHGDPFDLVDSPQPLEIASRDLIYSLPFDAKAAEQSSAAAMIRQDEFWLSLPALSLLESPQPRRKLPTPTEADQALPPPAAPAPSRLGLRALHEENPTAEMTSGAYFEPTHESLGRKWTAQRDLLESQPFGTEFVAEPGADGRIQVRFGDGNQGRRPAAGAVFSAEYRVGDGDRGRIGPGALAHVVVTSEIESHWPPRPPLTFTGVRNPLPSQGGKAPQALEQARLVGPRLFRQHATCVTLEDTTRKVAGLPGVLCAAGELLWAGSCHTVRLYVQREGDRELTPEFQRSLHSELEPLMVAGRDLEIRAPKTLPVTIRLSGRLDQGFVLEEVAEKLAGVLGTREHEGGKRGYFHPDNLLLGRPLDLGAVLDEAMSVPGVLSMTATLFRPYGETARRPLSRANSRVAPETQVLHRIEPGPFQVIEMRDLPGKGERGSLTIELEEGV
ncbi:MAG: hypothetical protein ACE5GX_02485 [Thermoanaerobaculia bacterium]